jgi:hypothetical protein
MGEDRDQAWQDLYAWLGAQVKECRARLKRSFGVDSLEAHARTGQLQDVRARMRELDRGLRPGKADEPWVG